MCRRARRDSRVSGIDGDSKRSLVRLGVVGDHLRQIEGLCQGRAHGRADDARGVGDHEGHGALGHELGGHDEVAFVFAVGGVEDDDEAAIFWGRGERVSGCGLGGGRRDLELRTEI